MVRRNSFYHNHLYQRSRGRTELGSWGGGCYNTFPVEGFHGLREAQPQRWGEGSSWRKPSIRPRWPRRRSDVTSPTRCRSSWRAPCPTCATASSRCSGASSTRCGNDLHLHADDRPAKCAKHRRRRDGQVSPPRRHGRSTTPWCAWPRSGSCAASWWTGRATSAPSMATRRPPTATPRPSSPSSRSDCWASWTGRSSPSSRSRNRGGNAHPHAANLRQRDGRAGGVAGPVPQPARQRRLGHRRRPGHEHPAAQPRRGGQGVRYPHRQPRGDDGPAARPRQGAGLPAGRQGRHRPADAAQDLRGGHRQHQGAGRVAAGEVAASGSSCWSRRSPTAWTRASWRTTSAPSSSRGRCRSCWA